MKSKIVTAFTIIALTLSACSVKENENINVEASITALGNLPENPLLLTPMTSLINRKANTMSVVYGNELAIEYADTNGGNIYPSGALLYKVTWQAKPDALWFGAKIPDKIKQVERVAFNDNKPALYNVYGGKTLEEEHVDEATVLQRIDGITSLKMAVSP